MLTMLLVLEKAVGEYSKYLDNKGKILESIYNIDEFPTEVNYLFIKFFFLFGSLFIDSKELIESHIADEFKIVQNWNILLEEINTNFLEFFKDQIQEKLNRKHLMIKQITAETPIKQIV